MRTKGGLRRRLMLMAAAVVGGILITESIAWIILDRLDRSLERLRVESLADVRRVLTLAENASGLTAFAHEVAEIRDRAALAVAERALEGRLEDFAGLAATLPIETGRPALPTLEPTIVRLADRLDGILRHLFAVTAEAIETRGRLAISADGGSFADPRQRFLLAAATVAAHQMSGLVRDYASLVERSDRARGDALSADLRIGKIAAGTIGALALLAALVLANAALRGVGADLLGIAEAMLRLADGDTAGTVPAGHRDDEVGALARAFHVFRARTRENAELEDRLRRAEQLEAIGRLTGGIAHDFNNLLTAVATNLQLIHDAADLGSPTRTRALRALAAAENGAAMVSHLLAFGRRQALAPVATDVDRLVSAVADLIEASLGAGITVETGRDADALPPLLALVDPGGLENALINLVFNARDAVGARGRIVVSTGRAPDGMVRLRVADDGVGMEPATLARVFEPFFTTKPAGAGSGLGLSMVYGFVRQSGGRIDVASRPQEGTTFTVDLPACDPVAIPSDIAPPASEAANPAAPGGVRILVVEDDPGVRASIVDLLAGLGHRCDAVASGPEALARLAADAAFDLLITDLALDGTTSGVDLIAALRVDHPALPVLVVTGYLGDAKPDRPVLMKPFRREDLAAAVARALADAAPAAPRPASDPAPQA